ncbi:MAG: hypothetical protein KJO21_04745 [Verrucomicrobiae bacterium]|nr:hypothetical protein [Verrucomicrobiae bacterium]NNJ43030.1 hypothetical protein [Akkermansiaceae bacterium]
MKYTTLILCSALALASCGEKKSTPDEAAPASAGATLETLIVTSSPAGALSITEARKSPEVGKVVTLEGKVMGHVDPFVQGRAMLILGDPAVITSCDLRPGDSCTTPWDVCCDDNDVIKAATTTIQVLDQDGMLIKQGLKGLHGIKELSELVVQGTIAEGSHDDNLLINATKIFVKPSNPSNH